MQGVIADQTLDSFYSFLAKLIALPKTTLVKMGLPKKKESSSNHQGRVLKFTMHVHCSIQTVKKAPTLSPQSSAVQSRTST